MTDDSGFDGKDSEFDGRKRRMDAHNIVTPGPSLLILALSRIFGTKLICFTFCEVLQSSTSSTKSILTGERSRWFDAISGRFDCAGYNTRISFRFQWFLPTCDHAFSDNDNGANQSLCITFEHLEALYIEYWTESLWSRARFWNPSLPRCWYLN